MKRILALVISVLIISTLAGCTQKDGIETISFRDTDFSQVQSGVLRNMHNGKGTYITTPEDIQEICAFLRTIRGKDGISSKGYYEGIYTLTLYANPSATQAVLKEEAPLFSIGFGDKDTFHYGDFGDGYPVRYTLQGTTTDKIVEKLATYDLGK